MITTGTSPTSIVGEAEVARQAAEIAGGPTADAGINLHTTFDSRVWAEEFCRIVGEKIPAMAGERDLMWAWFANALMKGWDAGRHFERIDDREGTGR